MDIEQLLAELKRRYPGGSPYTKLEDLMAANEDLLPGLIRLSLRSVALYQMPAAKYLKSQGILKSRTGKVRSAPSGERRRNKKLERILEQLDAYYPEHKVFSLDSIDKELREHISTLSKEMGYEGVAQFLLAYGYEAISGEDVRKIRNTVLYSPGNEPEIIQPKVRSVLSRLEEYYPGHVIPRCMQLDHKNLSKNISGLYQWLGYENAKAMLAAYGYDYLPGKPGDSAGRPARDYQPILDTLVEKYRDGKKPKTTKQLVAENPEYAGAIKSLQNIAVERFGMSLKAYFVQLGVFEEGRREKTVPEEPEEVVPEENSEADEEPERKKAAAKELLEAFVKTLEERYPAGTPRESLMLHLRKANPDLPYMDAFLWCKLLYGKHLKEYLEEIGILVPEQAEPDCNPNPEQKNANSGAGTSSLDADDLIQGEAAEFHIPSKPAVPQVAAPEKIANPEEASPAEEFPDAYLAACVKQDTEEFSRYIAENALQYSMSELYCFLRKLHRQECSSYLKAKESVSYGEYLTVHGLIGARSKAYWAEELLRYLNAHFQECSGGMLVYDRPSYEYDPIRKLCKIAAPLYEGDHRITSIRLAENYSGKPELQPCYCEQNYSCDVALTSNGKIIGQLSRTLFRTGGLGLYLSPVLYSGAAAPRNIRISGDELPQVIFELQLK